MNEQIIWAKQEVEAKQAFVEFVRDQIGKELGYENPQCCFRCRGRRNGNGLCDNVFPQELFQFF